MRFLALLLVVIVLGLSTVLATSDHVWSTWDSFEPDTCASIWLIKRHVDPDARFEFRPKGSALDRGKPFDTPDAKLRRYATAATYETILREYRISDRAASEIGRIVHDIEINAWNRTSTAESRDVERAVREIVAASRSHGELVDRTLAYFDSLATRIRNTPPMEAPR